MIWDGMGTVGLELTDWLAWFGPSYLRFLLSARIEMLMTLSLFLPFLLSFHSFLSLHIFLSLCYRDQNVGIRDRFLFRFFWHKGPGFVRSTFCFIHLEEAEAESTFSQ